MPRKRRRLAADDQGFSGVCFSAGGNECLDLARKEWAKMNFSKLGQGDKLMLL